jgi:hypothetical protein
LLLALAASCIDQENAAIPQNPQTIVSGCTEELFEKAERLFRYRGWGGSEGLGAAERQLGEVVRLCSETPGAFQAKEQLRVVHEEMADGKLSIALIYPDRFPNGKGRTAALSSQEEKALDQVLNTEGTVQ